MQSCILFPTATVGWVTIFNRETWRQKMRADSVLDDGSYNIALSGEIEGGFLDQDVIRPWKAVRDRSGIHRIGIKEENERECTI